MSKPQPKPRLAVVPFPESRTLAEVDRAVWVCPTCVRSRPREAICTGLRDCVSFNPSGNKVA